MQCSRTFTCIHVITCTCIFYNVHNTVHYILRLLLSLSLSLSLSPLLMSANVHVPRDRITQSHQGYGFVEFMSEEDADYAIKIMNMIKLYGKPIRVNKVRVLWA